MTKTQIKRALKRKAISGSNRYDIHEDAFKEALNFADGFIGGMSNDHWRTFFLLVAEAM